ncbi:MAG: S41 family peptidase [Gammaproteobacteria bacterium]|nr:S41 family peptidase [Gammaproteobacteria bacterium]
MKLKLVLLITLWWSSAAALAETAGTGKQGGQPLPLEELRVFAEVFGKIKGEYVDPTDDAALLRDAIRGMLSGLDPHSAFLDPKAFKDMRMATEGKFGGLGIEVAAEGGLIKVVAPLDGTPAQRAGIRAGDIIEMLDGVPVRGMSLRDAVDKMRGPPGSEIVLTISREGQSDALDISLKRAIIQVSSVNSETLEKGFGYLRITGFQGGTGANLRAAIEKLKRRNGGPLKGLVLDLRNNPGGVLQSAVEVSDVFLDSGVIVSIRGRNADEDHHFTATSPDLTGDVPVVVLVNGGTASASEIVAGALQDHPRAIIMGTRTFGKGSVQTVVPVNSGGALKLTTARYYTPAERSIQVLGIAPDIIVEAAQPPAPGQSGRPVREADLAGHLENDNADQGRQTGSGAQAKAGLAARDYQVGEALKLLKGMSLVKLRGETAKPGSEEG